MDTANFDLELGGTWQFHPGSIPVRSPLSLAETGSSCKAGGRLTHLSQVDWQEVRLPHDWLTEVPVTPEANPAGGYKPRGEGWYRKVFSLPDMVIDRARLIFDGVLGECTVYVNDVLVLRNFSGYNRFSADIGDYLLSGTTNTVTVAVDARQWEGWWYEGAGIYRPVRIAFRPETCFDTESCFIRCEKDSQWQIRTDLPILGDPSGCSITAHLIDPTGQIVAEQQTPEFSLVFSCPDPQLWTPEHPRLYRLECTLIRNGQILDRISHRVGLRFITWNADTGMVLNGKPYPIRGVCCHQDHGGLGAAVPAEVMEYRLLRLKELGCNAYRCAHHAPSEDLLALCDRLGMLVMAENRHFSLAPEVLEQVDALVRLCRNHSCIFLYSLFNEEPWQGTARGFRITEKLARRIRQLDPTRAITAGQNGGLLEEPNASDALDVIGINYNLKLYDAIHARSPGKVLLGTENCPTYATRGEYRTHDHVFGNFGDDWPRHFSEPLHETMLAFARMPYVGGCFVWSGFDHKGEPMPHDWPSVSSHWGLHDTCGFAKDYAHQLKAWYRSDLICHLFPHWNHEPGEQVRVGVYTNGTTAELFLNGESLGCQTVPEEKRMFRDVTFQPGTLAVRVRRDDEECWQRITTSGPAARLLAEDVTPASTAPACRILNLRMVDASGILLPEGEGVLSLLPEGGQILGVGNGNPNAHHPDRGPELPLFHGQAQVILSAQIRKLTITCPGLPPVQLNFPKVPEKTFLS